MKKNDNIPATMISSRKTLGEEYDNMPESMRPEEGQTLGFETDIEEIRDILKRSSYNEVGIDTP